MGGALLGRKAGGRGPWLQLGVSSFPLARGAGVGPERLLPTHSCSGVSAAGNGVPGYKVATGRKAQLNPQKRMGLEEIQFYPSPCKSLGLSAAERRGVPARRLHSLKRLEQKRLGEREETQL